MEDHPGYAKQDVKGRGSGNSCNGFTRKGLKGDSGEIEIEAPRDRNAGFEPHSLKLVAWKDDPAVTQGLKEIDQSVCETEASVALKVVYLAINQASRKWTMPIQNWKLTLNRFSKEFGDRETVHL